MFELMGLYESGSNAQGNISNEQTEHRYFIAPGVIYTRFGAAVSGGEITNIPKEQYTYSFKDRLGSPVVQMITKTGEAPRIERRGFDPFGKPRDGNLLDSNQGRLGPIVPAAGLDPTKLPTSMRGFTDHQHLDGLQLIHMRGRIYDYNLGRFWSVDPIIQFPANSQSLNAYSYIMNNPMSGTDPTGYRSVCITADSCVTVVLDGNMSSASARATVSVGDKSLSAGVTVQTKGAKMVSQASSVANSSKGAIGEMADRGKRGLANGIVEMGQRGEPGTAAENGVGFLTQIANIGMQASAALTSAIMSNNLGMEVDIETPSLTIANRGLEGAAAADVVSVVTPLVAAKLGKLAGLGRVASGTPETFYRSMSQAHYDELLATGKLPATAETFISPAKAFASNYDGVLVQFNVRGGTTQALTGVGVRDGSRLVGQVHGSLPSVSTVDNWTLNNAYFKAERGQINIGLGRGTGLDTFNANILNFSAISK